ncbi:hypothetical protein C9374_006067 [Naegleria lovaniensis]|uniref:Uncharacterized protein n=1 Tax=Naegleria lovaniensis TaxID=51637 RepID=A0AA88GN72_NAELO|nr:uncharacterized protein C9374_006067 [Naegleria lovaniensis]KAG2381683.1 hypothetical protein C9374_006067 [Naegleria lovaniensis]
MSNQNYHLDVYLSNGKAFCSFPSSAISNHEELILFLEREYEKFYPTEDSISIKSIQHLYFDKESGMPVKFELPTNWEGLASQLQVKSKIIEVICGNNPSLFLQVEKSENEHYNDIVSPVPGSVRKKAVENSVINSVASSLSFNANKNLHSKASTNNLTLPRVGDDSATDEKVIIFAEDDDTVFDDAIEEMEKKASQGSQTVNTNEPSSPSVVAIVEEVDATTANSQSKANNINAVTNDTKPIDNVNGKANNAASEVHMDTKDDNKHEIEDEDFIFSIESDELNEQPLFSSEKQADIANVSPVMDASYEDTQIDEEQQESSQKATPQHQEQTKEDDNAMIDEDEDLQKTANDNVLFTQNPTLEQPEEEPKSITSQEERKHDKLSQTPSSQSKSVTPGKTKVNSEKSTSIAPPQKASKPFSFASIASQKSDTKPTLSSSQERASSFKHSQENNTTTATPSKKSSQTNTNMTPKQSSQPTVEERTSSQPQSLQPFTPSTPVSLLQRIKNCKTPNPSSSQETKERDMDVKSKSASKIQKNKSKVVDKLVKDAMLQWNQKKK